MIRVRQSAVKGSNGDSAMLNLDIHLPGPASNWIAAGALLVSLAVALGQFRGYRAKQRYEKAQRDYYLREIHGRALLRVGWPFRHSLHLTNDGPEHAVDVIVRITAADGKPIPDLVQPDPIPIFSAGTVMHKMPFRWKAPPGMRTNTGSTSEQYVSYYSGGPILPDTILVHVDWSDSKGSHSARQFLTKH